MSFRYSKLIKSSKTCSKSLQWNIKRKKAEENSHAQVMCTNEVVIFAPVRTGKSTTQILVSKRLLILFVEKNELHSQLSWKFMRQHLFAHGKLVYCLLC